MLSTPMIQVSGASGESGERDVRVVLRRDMYRKGRELQLLWPVFVVGERVFITHEVLLL